MVNAQTQPPDPEELINAINEWRSSKGIEILKMDSKLMSSAQAHSDYQASINTYTHYSADKSDVVDRAIMAGFGAGGLVTCRETLAFTSISTNLDTVVNTVWNNAKDRDLVLLNPDLEFIGAGISRKDASLFYTVDVCSVDKTAVTPGSGDLSVVTAAAKPTTDVVEVLVATPQPNGAVTHLVSPGQAVWSIAIAYGTTINEIVSLNGLNPSNPQIFAGQTLVIRMANTPTATPTLSPTPRPPTLTPSLTSTRVLTSTPTITPTPTKEPLIPWLDDLKTKQNRPLGFLFIGISALGILLVFLSALRNRHRD